MGYALPTHPAQDKTDRLKPVVLTLGWADIDPVLSPTSMPFQWSMENHIVRILPYM